MSDFLDSDLGSFLMFCVGVIGGVFVVGVLIWLLLYPIMYYDCSFSASKLGLDFYYHWFTGCYVGVDSIWVPLSNLAIVP